MIPAYLTGQVRDRPQIASYRWRGRTYPHAVRAIELAEAEHGPPKPTCLVCGGHVTYSHEVVGGQCDDCGQSPLTAVTHVDWQRAAPGGRRAGAAS